MTRVYWDSMLFIYLLEANPVFGPKARKILHQTMSRGDVVCTSVFSLGEILTGARRRGSSSGVDAIKKHLLGGGIEILPFTASTAGKYSSIRAEHKVSQADAIHLASASEAGVDLFFTNDAALRKLTIPGIKFFGDLDGKVI